VGAAAGGVRRVVIPLTIIAVLMALVSSVPVGASAVGPVFGLTHNLGAAGGEPSIQDDGQGHLYITTPNGLGSISSGVTLSRSLNGGTTFLAPQLVGGLVGGGDSDVVADVTGLNSYVADLAGSHANVLRSADFGATFGPAVPAGFVNDREWLTTIGPNVYLTYHDLTTNAPEIYGSTDGGQIFTPLGADPAGHMLSPSDPAFADNTCNTLVGKPVTDTAGTLYVLSNTTTAAENAQVGCVLPPPALERFYMLISKDGGHTFTSHLVNDLTTAVTGKAKPGTWGHVFNQLAIDAAGNLYIDASGSLDGNLPLQNYLLVSTDHGATFSKPIATQASVNGQLFPAIAAGQAGQVAVGYYQGTKPDHHADKSNFQFYVDQTLNATDPSPTFTHTKLDPLKGTTPHPNGICTDGIFCGTFASSGGNRNLADFESMTVDPTGNLEVIIPADCAGATACDGTVENWFYKQTLGPLMPPGPTNGNGTGNQTWVPGARTAPPPAPVTAAAASIKPGLPNTAPGLPPRAAAVLIAAIGVVALLAWALPGARLRHRD
jgi:hypothetical protein